MSCRVALLVLIVVAAWGAVAGCERTADEAQPAGTVEIQEVSLPPTPAPETPTVAAPATPTPTISTPTPSATDTPTPVRPTPTPVATVTSTPVKSTPTPAATATPTPETTTPAATPPALPTPARPALTATPAPRGQREVPSAWQLETRSSPELAAQYPLTTLYTADEIAYFKEIAFKEDLRLAALLYPAAIEEVFKGGVAYKDGVQKWGSGQVVTYYVEVGDELTASDLAEIHTVIARLDALIPVLDFRPVEEPSDASLEVFGATYDEFQRETVPDIDVARWRATPYASFSTVENFVVVKSSVLINADQPPEIRRRSIIKGLAASVGLDGNSWSYPDSVFYEGVSSGTELADIDEALIRLLYDPRIKPGMTIEELERMGL